MSAVCTRPSAVVTLQPICDWRRNLETGSRLTTDAFTLPPRRNSTSLSSNCSDSSRLSPTSCESNTHRRRNSTRQLSCVGGVCDTYCQSTCLSVSAKFQKVSDLWGSCPTGTQQESATARRLVTSSMTSRDSMTSNS